MLGNFQHNPDRLGGCCGAVENLIGLLPRRHRRAAPSPATGLLGALLAAEVDGDRLTDEEVIANVIVTMVGGQETTTNLIGNGMLTLLRNPRPARRGCATDPAIMPSARSRSCCATRARASTPRGCARDDVELGGKQIRKGQAVIAVMAAGNRDPERFPDPDRLDLDAAGQPAPRVRLGRALLLRRAAGAHGGADRLRDCMFQFCWGRLFTFSAQSRADDSSMPRSEQAGIHASDPRTDGARREGARDRSGRIGLCERDGDGGVIWVAGHVSAFQFSSIRAIAEAHGLTDCDGVVADIGMSSMMVDDPSRGFSFMREGPLDMRMDRNQALTAADVLNTYSEKEIADILYLYGEERRSRPIAARSCAPVRFTARRISLPRSNAFPAGRVTVRFILRRVRFRR